VIWEFDVVICMQALLAARNTAGVVFIGTFGALSYVLSFHGDLDFLVYLCLNGVFLDSLIFILHQYFFIK